MTRIFNKEELLELMTDPVHEKIVDQGRWNTSYYVVFKYEDKYYGVSYSRGSTEYQDNGIEFYDETKDGVECTEVHQVEKIVKVWETVKSCNE